jgi:hypothetical protein
VTISSSRGSAAVEFAVTAIPLLFVLISVMWMCMGMWEYHTLAEAVNSTIRSASVHGAGCAGQTCATTVDSTARLLAGKTLGISPGSLNVTLTSSASTVTCNPLSTCYGNTAHWPSLSGNVAGSTDISISVTFQFVPTILIWAPGHGDDSLRSLTLGANARQSVVF